jgi:copper transport protein
MTVRRLVVGAALAVVVVLVTAGPAAAHATLESTSPADGEHLDRAPSEVTLTFSEDIGAPPGAVRVFNGQGHRVDDGDVRARDNTARVGLNSIGDGGYIVTWRVISADSHPVNGAFTFTVGNGTAASAGLVSSLLNSGSNKKWDVAGNIARGIGYAGTFLAAGGAVFLAIVHDGRPDRRRLAEVVLWAAIVGAIGVLVQIPISAALATGLGLGSVTHEGVLSQVLADGVGAQTVTVLLGLAVATTAVLWKTRTTATRVAAVVGGAAAAIGFSFAGHTTVTAPRWLVYTSDIVHVLAASVWFGGLVFLFLFLRRQRAEAGDAVHAGGVVARFSRLAGFAIVAVGIAGSVLAYEEIRALSALTSTTYGKLVLIKLGVVAVIAAVAAYNRYRLVPALRRAEAHGRNAWSHLTSTVRIEMVGMLVVIGLTGVLVNQVPARTAAGIGTIYSQSKELTPTHNTVNLVVDPNRVGANAIHMYILDATGRTVDAPNGVTVKISYPAQNIGPFERKADQGGPGHYLLVGNTDLSTAGQWKIEVDAQFSKFEVGTATFDVNVNS